VASASTVPTAPATPKASRRRLLLAAGLFALLAAGGFLKFFLDVQQTYAADPVWIIFAATDIPKGQPAERHKLSRKAIPQRFVHPKAIKVDDAESIVGLLPLRDLKADDPILLTDFHEEGRVTHLARLIPEGYRALTLPVDRVTSAGGNLRPNDHVDILATMRWQDLARVGAAKGARTSEEAAADLMTVMVLQNVVLIAVGEAVGAVGSANEEARRNSQTVTVAITPDEAHRIIHFMKRGEISLIVRNPDDLEAVDPEATGMQQFKNVLDVQDLKKLQKLRDERMQKASTKPRPQRTRDKPAADSGPVSLTPGN